MGYKKEIWSLEILVKFVKIGISVDGAQVYFVLDPKMLGELKAENFYILGATSVCEKYPLLERVKEA